MRQGVSTTSNASPATDRPVGPMFDRIATRYDLLNHLLSLGRDVAWRRRAVGYLPTDRPLHVIDLAAGTGDQLIALLRHRPNVAEAVGLDISANMLDVCRKKLRRHGLTKQVRLVCQDAAATSFPDNTFDATTMAFGIRNTADVSRTLREMLRILKPGGIAVMLEFSLPTNRVIQRCYLTYLRFAVPLIGSVVSGHGDAYRYLNDSIEGFYQAQEFLSLMRAAGFASVSATPLTFGVASIYTGLKVSSEVGSERPR